MVGYQNFLKKWVGSAVKQPYTSPFFQVILPRFTLARVKLPLWRCFPPPLTPKSCRFKTSRNKIYAWIPCKSLYAWTLQLSMHISLIRLWSVLRSKYVIKFISAPSWDDFFPLKISHWQLFWKRAFEFHSGRLYNYSDIWP